MFKLIKNTMLFACGALTGAVGLVGGGLYLMTKAAPDAIDHFRRGLAEGACEMFSYYPYPKWRSKRIKATLEPYYFNPKGRSENEPVRCWYTPTPLYITKNDCDDEITIEPFQVATVADAYKLIEQIDSLCNQYAYASIHDLLDLADITSPFNADYGNYGWDSTEGFEISKSSTFKSGTVGWPYISVPPAKPFNKGKENC